MADPRVIKRLFEKAKAERMIHEPELIEVYRYVLPWRPFNQSLEMDQNQIDRSDEWDTTAYRAARDLSTAIMKNLIPQTSSWAQIKVRDRTPNADAIRGSFAVAIQSANQKLYDHLQTRNMLSALTERLQDYIVGGTMCLQFYDVMGEDLEYMRVPLNQLYFLLNKTKSKIDTVFREHILYGYQLEQRTEWTLPPELAQQIENNPVKKIKILESAIPNPKGGFDYCVRYGGDCKVLYQKTLELRPFVVARFQAIPGQSWGNSPARSALTDIRIVNEMQYDVMKYAELAAIGFWTSDSGTILSDGSQAPRIKGGVIMPMDKGTKLDGIELPGNFNITLDLIKSIQQNIRDHMFQINMPDPDSISYAKAETIAFLRQQFNDAIGEPSLRLGNDFLQPLAAQAAARLFKRGEIQIADAAQLKVLKVKTQVQALNKVFGVDISAAIEKVKAQQEASSSLQGYQAMYQVFGPQLTALNYQPEVMVRKIGLDMGISPNYLRPEAQVTQIGESLQQGMQQLNQSQQATGQAGGQDAHGNNIAIQSALTAFTQGAQQQGASPGGNQA